jgi:hypothetical protein
VLEIGDALGAANAHIMTVRTVNAIPTANNNLAGFGFGAMYPSWLQYRGDPSLWPRPRIGFLLVVIGLIQFEKLRWFR